MDVRDIIKSLDRASRPVSQVHGPVTSEIIGLRVPQSGATYRVKAPQARSIRLTKRYARFGWYGSPYALRRSARAKHEHSYRRAARIGNLLWR